MVVEDHSDRAIRWVVGVELLEDARDFLRVDGQIVVNVGAAEARVGKVAGPVGRDTVEHVGQLAVGIGVGDLGGPPELGQEGHVDDRAAQPRAQAGHRLGYPAALAAAGHHDPGRVDLGAGERKVPVVDPGAGVILAAEQIPAYMKSPLFCAVSKA